MSENFVTCVCGAVVANGLPCPRCVPAVAEPVVEPMVSVPRAMLKKWQRDLDACQKVIRLRGGLDPAYCADAQDCIKEMDVILAKRRDGYCSSAAYCMCGGDTQGVSETCDYWVKP